jgi:hypothetical protein
LFLHYFLFGQRRLFFVLSFKHQRERSTALPQQRNVIQFRYLLINVRPGEKGTKYFEN